MNLEDEARMSEKAEILEMVLSASLDDDLGKWLDLAVYSIPETPQTVEEAVGIFARLLERAKADGVYPIKPKV